MRMTLWKSVWLAGAAAVALAPGVAHADPAKEAALEARLAELESAVAALKGELNATRSEQQAVAATNAATGERVAALETKVAKPAPPPPDGFTVAGTTVKLNGYVKANVMFSRYDDGDVANGFGRDFYLPQTIPVGGTRESNDFDGHAKQTRLWLTTSTPVAGHTLKGHLEFDFQTSPGTQASERTTNGYNLALRRAFVAYDNLLVGQEWSNFQYVAALPESTDFVGPTEGTVFARQMQVRYTKKLSKELTLSVAAENPETASATTLSPALAENDDDSVPDVTARLNYAASFGELSLAGVFRKLSVDNGAVSADATGWGVSAAGKVPFGPNKRHDVRFMATAGKGLGRYVGLNFAPDAILTAGANPDLETVDVLAGFVAVKLGWTANLRSTFMASYQDVDYPTGFVPPGANKQAWSAAGNLFYSPVKGLDLGVEYRHGVRELVSGAKGQLDRLEFAAKYSF